jgi:hypothetical protein
MNRKSPWTHHHSDDRGEDYRGEEPKLQDQDVKSRIAYNSISLLYHVHHHHENRHLDEIQIVELSTYFEDAKKKNNDE